MGLVAMRQPALVPATPTADFFVQAGDSRRTFTPRSIPGCVLWLEADYLYGIPDGTGVAIWPDLSGYGNHATQTTVASQPIVKDNIVNGHRVVRWSSTYMSVGRAALTNGNNLTVVAVLTPSGDLASRRTFFSTRAGAVAGSMAIEVGPGTGGTAVVAQVTPGHFDAQTPDNAIAVGGWYVVAFTRSANHQALYVNGVQQTLAVDSPIAFVDNGDEKLIGAQNTSLSQPFLGDIAGLYAFNREVSAAELSRFNRYLRKFVPTAA